MSIQNDRAIADLITRGHIRGAEAGTKIRRDLTGRPVISYGISSFGYDIRLGADIKLFVPVPGRRINPKRFDTHLLVAPPIVHDTDGIWFELPSAPSFALAVSEEWFDIPPDMLCIVMGKSTYARCGLVLNTTPLEPNWRGNITLELSNTSPLPLQVFIGEGIGQVVFFKGEPPEQGYGGGVYQDQGSSITPPRVG